MRASTVPRLDMSQLSQSEMQIDEKLQLLHRKFPNELEANAVLLDSFVCAYQSEKFLLQGILHLTNSGLYFCSPFNPSTLFGRSSKIALRYADIQSLHKETTLLLFRDSIKVTLHSGFVVTFKSFLSRDTCFSFILSQMMTLAHSGNYFLKVSRKSVDKI